MWFLDILEDIKSFDGLPMDKKTAREVTWIFQYNGGIHKCQSTMAHLKKLPLFVPRNDFGLQNSN